MLSQPCDDDDDGVEWERHREKVFAYLRTCHSHIVVVLRLICLHFDVKTEKDKKLSIVPMDGNCKRMKIENSVDHWHFPRHWIKKRHLTIFYQRNNIKSKQKKFCVHGKLVKN